MSISSFSKSLAFLSSIGYNLLIVNYRYFVVVAVIREVVPF